MTILRTASPMEAWEALQEGRGSLLDVREPGEYETVRVPRSQNFPLSSLEDRLTELPAGDQPFYVLCAVGARAVAASKILFENKRNGIVIQGGIVEWQRRGLPIERGERNVWSIDRQVRFLAGSLVLTGLALGWRVNPRFYLLSAFIGAGLFFSGITGFCGMALLLARCPWNRGSRSSC